jgi:cycloartenol synthase
MVRALSEDLFSLNNHVGRHTWEFDASAGSAAEKEAVERARAAFAKHRHTQQHSADELLRMQYDATRAARGRRITVTPPPSEAYDAPRDANEAVPRAAVDRAMRAGVDFYQGLQDEDGHWASDYGGPMFLVPGLVISLYVAGELETTLDERRALRDAAVPARPPERGRRVRSAHRGAQHDVRHGFVVRRDASAGRRRGAGATPSRARRTTASQNARSWIRRARRRGERALLGQVLPVRAGRVRVGGPEPHPARGVAPAVQIQPPAPRPFLVPLPHGVPAHELPVRQARHRRLDAAGAPRCAAELYPDDAPYESIDWDKTRNACAKEDLYYPHPWLQDALWWGLTKVEPLLLRTKIGKALRGWACRVAARHARYEDENTRYVDIGPVNKAMNMLVAWHEAEEARRSNAPETFESRLPKHLPRVHDYLWLAEDGMKMQGYNGSQLWDCAFAAQAVAATGLAREYAGCLRDAHRYVRDSQVRDDCPGDLRKWYRHISKGAWPFSTRDHGWPISDCSSEGLKAALALEALGEDVAGAPVPLERMRDCVNVILSYQNRGSGGWATYENTRSFAWVEIINPAETFGDIMIDYPYVECSSASLQALAAFAARFPDDARVRDIARASTRGRAFLKSIQKPDGSWYGSWAVCFTYGTWFGVKGLLATGSTYATCAALRKAVAFLLSKQMADGGWGESYLSCQNKKYVQLTDDKRTGAGAPVDHIVNTAWALLALVAAGQAERDPAPLHAAARALMRRQRGKRRLPAADHHGRLQQQLHDHLRELPEHLPDLGAGRVRQGCARAGGQPAGGGRRGGEKRGGGAARREGRRQAGGRETAQGARRAGGRRRGGDASAGAQGLRVERRAVQRRRQLRRRVPVLQRRRRGRDRPEAAQVQLAEAAHELEEEGQGQEGLGRRVNRPS